MSTIEWEDVDSIVEALRIEHNIPGVSVSVVRKGYEPETRGFGRTRLDDPSQEWHADFFKDKVNERTAFCIGSITKSFTAMLLAEILQDRKDVTWHTPLKEIFGPAFKFQDQFRTDDVCLRDLLAHTLGIELGESDLGWMCEGLRRGDILRNLQHLPVAASFRTKMMYNNFMYSVAGLVAEKLTDASWESLIEGHFFQLLGVENATFIDRAVQSDRGLALPYLGQNGKLKQVSLDVHKGARMVGPAATICCSADDMAKWMTFLLSKGSIGEAAIIKESYFLECWKPQFALPQGKQEWDGYVSRPEFPVTESRDTYGFAFYLGSYRGYRYVAHGGELFGYDSLMTLYPELGIGIYSATNGPGEQPAHVAHQLLHYYLSDLCLKEEPWLDALSATTFPYPWKPKETVFHPKVQTSIVKSLPPSRQLCEYVGSYIHDFLGEMVVSIQHGCLHVSYGQIGSFNLFPDGEIDEFSMEGCGALEFIHQVDMFAPSDWMMVKFTTHSRLKEINISGLSCSLFESGPLFLKQ